MGSKRTEVGASAVREWFAGLNEAERTVKAKDGTETVLSVGARGKLSEAVIAEFERKTRNRYVAGFVEPRKIAGERPDASGRVRKVTVSATIPEVRAWAQTPEASAMGISVGARGRIDSKTLAAFAARPVAPKPSAPVASAE